MLILSRDWLLCCHHCCKALAANLAAISPRERRTFCARRYRSATASVAAMTSRELVLVAVMPQAAVE
jgi:hypothetical protein